jgi:RND family efflux transporter MFP subunit
MFLEYPHPVAGEATGNWAIHLTNQKDFQPIRSGTVTVRFVPTSGQAQTFTISEPLRDGIFLVDPVVQGEGTYRVEVSLESPQVSSHHTLPEVRVFGSLDQVPLAGEEEGGGIAFLKEHQWQIPFAIVTVEDGEVRRALSLPGEVVPPDGALAEVSAPVDGIAPAEANRDAPSVGARVRRGQRLVVLTPTTDAGGFAELKARVDRLEREVARDERLDAAGVIPRKRLEESRHDLELARAQAEAMGATGTGYGLELTAPLSGVVARRNFAPGGRVEAGEVLFTVVDPSAAWLRVQVPAAEAASVPIDAEAVFTVEGGDGTYRTAGVVSMGRVLDTGTRTVPLTFGIEGPGTRFAFGQLARAYVPVGSAERGALVPNQGIIDDNGTPVAYVQAEGEAFERRILTLGTTDGVRTRVLSGLRPGDRVVTVGAYEVRLASMSGGDFAGGHTH